MCERYIDWLPFTRPQLGTWPTTQMCALTGHQTGNLLVRRLVLNPLSHISPGCLVLFLQFDLFFHLGHVSLSPHFGSLPVFVPLY